jgi:thioredoxin 1
MANENVHVFNDLNFDSEVLGSEGKVLVDFTAAWCGPCKRLSPIVEEVATELAGKIKVGKLDVDEAPLTASKYRVMSVPTLMVFEGGEVVENAVGLIPKAKVLALVADSAKGGVGAG